MRRDRLSDDGDHQAKADFASIVAGSHVTLVADDLTGACDAGALFAGRGPVAIVVDPASPGLEWPVAAVDTESRALAASEAALAVAAAARRLRPRSERGLLFKKVDSTLRGAVGAETETLLEASGRRMALVCPAFPAQGRTVVDGVLLVNGTPAHVSPIARDPAYPGPGSSIIEIVRRGASHAVGFLSLVRVRGGHDGLVRVLHEGRERIVVADAETDGDLAALARAALGCGDVLPVGSAGLAGAVAVASGYASAPVDLPKGRAWLIVAGSLHPATRVELRRLEAAGTLGAWLHEGQSGVDTASLVDQIRKGRSVFVASDDTISVEPGAREVTAARLGGLGARILAESQPDLVVVTGGDTAVALLRAVGARQIELEGAPASGLALGRATGGARPFPLLTKAGGFGAPELFSRVLEDVRS